MNFRYQDNCNNIIWEDVMLLLKKVGMSYSTPQIHEVSFKNSHSVVFIFDNDKLIGSGRILSDGVRQSAVYDIAVDPDYQGQRLGNEIMSRLMAATPGCNFILYASPGKEGFYKKIAFKKMKTGMILFSDPERMNDESFIDNE